MKQQSLGSIIDDLYRCRTLIANCKTSPLPKATKRVDKLYSILALLSSELNLVMFPFKHLGEQ